MPSSSLALLDIEVELNWVVSVNFDKFQVKSLSKAWFDLLVFKLMWLISQSSTVEG